MLTISRRYKETLSHPLRVKGTARDPSSAIQHPYPLRQDVIVEGNKIQRAREGGLNTEITS